MTRSTLSPDTHTYLVDTHSPRTRNALKFSGALGVIFALGALSIWAFTPISEQPNYKLDRPIISNSIRSEATLNPLQPGADTRLEKLVSLSSQPDSELIALPDLNNIDDLIEDAEGDVYLELTTVNLHKHKHNSNIAENTLQDKPGDAMPAPMTIEAAPLASAKLVQTPTAEITTAKAPEKTLAKNTGAPSKSASADIRTFKIKSGDTLTRIFSNADLPISQAIKLSRNKSAARLNRLSIGKTLRIYYDQNKQLESLQYDIDKLNTLMVSAQDGEFDVYTHEKQVEYRTFTAQGSIESSLGTAAEVAGMPTGVAGDLIDIYKWEIDFARDLHKGDRFSVIYQKAFIEDEYIANGPILAASFSTGGRTIEAVRFTDSNNKTAYFQPNGDSLRRGFLRSPVSLARITSGFGNRLHPIKKTWKKHKGVDYGAKRGSPIVATADGVVQYAGKKGGYGNAVVLRHGGIYTTLYAHMSKLGKGVRSGKNVTQGQVIGYVGHSGWATGDHLHYEFRVNGQHKDPLKVKLPKSLPLAKQEHDAFIKQSTAMLATLESIKGTRVATLEVGPGESAL